jgi:ribonucleoside-triphosphate reductase
MHDARFFLQNGLNLETVNPAQTNYPPPRDFNTALATIFNALLHSAKETEATQTLEYFNTFLAPYAKNLEPAKTKEALHLFTTNLNQHANTTISLELTTPEFLAQEAAVGPHGKQADKYKHYTEESQQLASLLLDTFAEQTAQKPLINPQLIIKIRPETFKDERASAILLKAHALATQNGTPYFANLTEKSHEQTVHSPSGFKIEADANGDWEIDTLRTGCLGTVTVNVPRVAYESEKDSTKFIETLKERLEMANRALEIKHQALRQHGKNLLPFLMQKSNGDQYFRLEESSHIINLAGLNEAAEAFAEETAQNITSFINKIGRRRGKHLHTATMPNHEASTRLAQLDIERYGIARVRYSGTRDKPHYSTTTQLTIQNGKLPQQPQKTQNKTQIQTGGNLTLIELEETEHQPEQLLSITKQLIENQHTEFFTYNRKTTYCTNCKKTWPSHTHKCPSCNAVSTLTYFDRSNQT